MANIKPRSKRYRFIMTPITVELARNNHILGKSIYYTSGGGDFMLICNTVIFDTRPTENFYLRSFERIK